MKKLNVNLKNCYGIQSLEHTFDFGNGNDSERSIAIYAPNGLMKTSFTKSFENLANGKPPVEERYGRPSTATVEFEGKPLSKSSIYVLKSDIDIQADSPAITDILVDPENKARYDTLMVDLDKQKSKVINALQKASTVPKKDIEKTLLTIVGLPDFESCLASLAKRAISSKVDHLRYETIFDDKAIEVIKSAEFASKSKEFNERYQELFSQEGTIYQKGTFNPYKANESFGSLDKNGFFKGGHLVQMRGTNKSIGKAELDELVSKINVRIDADEELIKIRQYLAQNLKAQAFGELIENLPATEADELLERLRGENQIEFRRDFWAHFVQSTSDAEAYVQLFEQSQDEIKAIEIRAAQAVPKWTEAVELFNDRFVDMPFTLSISNQTLAALGKEKAKLVFTFKDGDDVAEWSRSEIKTLSQGEKRALYLLNFIFDTVARARSTDETVFIIDDVADSFDYKNKHAIVQYLADLDSNPNFYQIILTHNFDFFRSLATNFVHRKRCLMANRQDAGISLTQAHGINNYFIGILKEKVGKDQRVMCATIPFTRNLIEYVKNDKDKDYLKLTSLLHWKHDTQSITVAEYFSIYNDLFGKDYAGTDKPIIQVLFEQAQAIADDANYAGLNLEDKVVLSMAIRLISEKFMTEKIRALTKSPDFWCEELNQFGWLIKKFTELSNGVPELRTLEKVSITVSSNIHLNSFMYEPILDLTIEHLVRLFNEVQSLKVQPLEGCITATTDVAMSA